ncbi:hypothetical protein LPJ53_004623 [Coemansia erecta]|uniref:Dienelactone hydrolase domain-containing protein n=1 Tax=Coemansia erecta TaxID=147472 RepID=A0A9W8CRF8_9FUNG|nr:hypothetical protein LPJ53_004623 [Coemansia erecta]
MSFISACCNTLPVKGNYTPTGTTVTTEAMKYYIVGDKNSDRGVVMLYDIFGYHSNFFEVADLLSKTGLRVIIPDLLEGKYLTMADIGKPEVFVEFKNNQGTWESNKDKIVASVQLLKDEGAKSVGVLGYCWSAKLAILALGDANIGVKSAAMLHPSLLVTEDFANAKGPILLLPTKDEGDFSEGFNLVKQGPFGEDSYEERFTEMFHGFCGARGDFSDAETSKHVNRAVNLISNFFNKTLA